MSRGRRNLRAISIAVWRGFGEGRWDLAYTHVTSQPINIVIPRGPRSGHPGDLCVSVDRVDEVPRIAAVPRPWDDG